MRYYIARAQLLQPHPPKMQIVAPDIFVCSNYSNRIVYRKTAALQLLHLAFDRSSERGGTSAVTSDRDGSADRVCSRRTSLSPSSPVAPD